VRRRARPATPWFHGWLIVATAFVALAVNVGLLFYSWGVFLTPLADAFGGRARVAWAYSAMQAAAALYGLVVGRIVDRHGARPVQIVGAVVFAAGYALMGRVDSLAQLYVVMAVPIALGSTCIGALPSNGAVARWFVRKRGLALGISTAGISAGGIVFAPASQYLIEHLGWRRAYDVLAASVIVLVLPPVLAFMRRDPADLGLLPDGTTLPAAADREEHLALIERELARSMPPGAAMRTSSFWLLAAAFGLTMSGLSSVLLNQVAILVDRGMPATHASWVLGATAAMGVVGKLGFGSLLDRFDQRRVAAMCFVLQAAGVILLWQTRGVAALVCYVVLYGYAMGGNATLQASLVAEAFGRLHYGAVYGRVTPFVMLTQAIGIPLTSYLRDRTGSYDVALGAIVAASLVAVGLVLRVRLPRRAHGGPIFVANRDPGEASSIG
jgi:MFS family permease